MRMKLLALSMIALTLGTAGGALARDGSQWPNPQSHDSSLSLDSEVRWRAPKKQADIDRMYTNSLNRADPACDAQGTNNVRSTTGTHLGQGQGCD
jgi:hypothetical protein